MLRKLNVLLLVLALVLGMTVPARPARADLKKTGTVLAVVDLGLIGAGVVMYLTRGDKPADPNGFDLGGKKSATPAYIVGGAGLATMALGVSMLNRAKKKEQGTSLNLEPRPGAVALAYRF